MTAYAIGAAPTDSRSVDAGAWQALPEPAGGFQKRVGDLVFARSYIEGNEVPAEEWFQFRAQLAVIEIAPALRSSTIPTPRVIH
ncbi:MAG TPA: hypothetical protein VGM03_19035 [Phycisphaerae bacterium]